MLRLRADFLHFPAPVWNYLTAIPHWEVYYNDKSRAETAAALGIGKSHVELVEKRALRRLRSSGRVKNLLRAIHAERETYRPDIYGGGLRSFSYAGSSVERAVLWELERAAYLSRKSV